MALDGKLGALAANHGGHAFVPALDDAAHANLEGKGLAAIATRVKLCAVRQRARVVHLDIVALLWFLT